MEEECTGVGENLCIFHSYSTPMEKTRGICEAILVVWSVAYLVGAAKEMSHMGWRLFTKTLSLCPSRIMFLLACALVISAVPFR